MATRSAGRVTIRVIPDSTKFREDLKKSLERVEKTTKAVIPAELAVTRESIQKLRAQLRELEVRIKVEPYVTNEDIRDLKNRIEDVDPDVRVGLNTAIARARLTALTRPRTATIFVRVNKASLLAATQTLAALSGARFLGNVFEKFWDSIKNLDKSAPRIAAISSGFVTLAGVLGAAISNMAGLAGSFAALGQSAVLLPTLLTGSAISIGVLIAALKDMKEVLKDLGPSFTNLQDIISAKFWNQAAQPIRNLVNNLMPTLNDQLGQIAASWGNVFKVLAESLQETVTPDRLVGMMQNLKKSIDIAARAVHPLVQAFTTLGEFGSNYLPRLSEWLVKLSDQFNNFIQKAAADGRLDKWAENGIQAFKDLGRVIKETARVFAALTKAANAAGGSGFAQLADGLKKLADTMNTANFQTTFITILASAHDVVDGLIDGLNRLGPGLASFAPTIARVFDQVGKVLGQVGEDIGALLDVPELQSGIEHMFSGLLTFVTDLKPAMEPLGKIIGTFADIIGTLLSYFGLLLSEVAPYAADFFKELWEAVKPLIPTLTDLVEELLPPFSEILMTLAKDVLPAVVPIIKELAPIFVALLKALAPVIVEFLKDFAKALRDAEPFIGPVARGVKDLADAFKGLPLAFYQKSTGDDAGFLGTMAKFMTDHPEAAMYLSGIGQAVLTMGDAIKSFGKGVEFLDWIVRLGTALNDPKGGIINGVINLTTGILNLSAAKGGWDAFWGTVGEIITKISPIGPAFQIMVDTIKRGVDTVSALFAPWAGFFSSLNSPVNLAMTLVTNTINGGFGTMLLSFITGFIGLKMNWEANWPTLLPAVTNTFILLAAGVRNGFPGMIAAVVIGMSNILQGFGRGWLTIIGQIPGWFGAIVGGVAAGIAIVVARVFGLPNSMLAVLFGYAGRFAAAGESLISNFAAGISRGVGIAVLAIKGVIAAVTGHLPGSPAKVGPLSGRGYTLLRGQRMVENFAEGMKQRTGAVQTASLGVASAVRFGDTNVRWRSADSDIGASNDRALVNIEGDYYGATPEKVANEFEKKTRRANLAAQISKVGK